MSQPYQSQFTSDAEMTTLNAALALNTTATALVKTYADASRALLAATVSAEATAIATPTQGNLDAVVTAINNYSTSGNGNERAAAVGGTAIKTAAFNRTFVPLKNALADAANKLDAAAKALGSDSSITQANLSLQKSLNDAANRARQFSASALTWTKIEECQGAIDFLTA